VYIKGNYLLYWLGMREVQKNQVENRVDSTTVAGRPKSRTESKDRGVDCYTNY
jgi:hypothetical protein